MWTMKVNVGLYEDEQELFPKYAQYIKETYNGGIWRVWPQNERGSWR